MLKAQLIGNLGADAVVNKTDNGSFVSLNVAHTRRFSVLGQKYEETIWVSVTINWNCEKILPYLLKGTKVFVSGPVRLRVFTGHDGKPHAGMTIICDDIELCGSAKPDTNKPQNSNNDDTNESPF